MGWRFEASAGAGFHVAVQGSAWLIPSEGEPVALGPGTRRRAKVPSSSAWRQGSEMVPRPDALTAAREVVNRWGSTVLECVRARMSEPPGSNRHALRQGTGVLASNA
ncbi:cupin domain-containing protein [Streptomyces sp. NPDC048825]|uniref:cupin domain-containing protein n=1 Tax=Streptomyces sp. NPDC048825 TaxID=3365592 RepID=UPI0037200240